MLIGRKFDGLRSATAAGVLGRLSHCCIIRLAELVPRFNSGGVRRLRGDSSSGSLYTCATDAVEGTGNRRTFVGVIARDLMRKGEVDRGRGIGVGSGLCRDDEACDCCSNRLARSLTLGPLETDEPFEGSEE